MPLETPARIVRELARRGYNAEREAVTLIAETDAPAATLELVVEAAPDDTLRITAAHVREVSAPSPAADPPGVPSDSADSASADPSGDAESEAGAETSSAFADDARTPAPTDPDVGDDAGTSADADSTDPAATDPTEVDPAETHPTAGDAAATGAAPAEPGRTSAAGDPSASTPDTPPESGESAPEAPVETKGSPSPDASPGASDRPTDSSGSDAPASRGRTPSDPSRRSVEVTGDVTGQSTGTGEYDDFVKVFRDRYDRLSKRLRGRVNHRPARAISEMAGGGDVELIGLVNDIRSTANGHHLIELEDTTGTFPCLVTKDRDIAELVDELLLDECVAVQGTLSDDAGIVFVDALYFPDVPRTFSPSTADRHVQAALISDVHVGSQEFAADAWHRFADWLHTEEAETVEYLLIAGDMVEGVGVYPDQDEELDIVDIYDQYETFSEYLKEVPGDIDVHMIPGNHDAVRLAEPQPGFDDELREIMSAHDARITGNPSTVTIEGVSVLMYHGVSLDEVIAELPEQKASYDEPHKAMYQLLKKRHVAPQYGGHMRLAPEEKDYLVIDDVPEVFHTGHVHKLGWGKYHNVLSVNTGCWQTQTAFQKSVNIDPDVGYAPILDLDTLDMTVRKFT